MNKTVKAILKDISLRLCIPLEVVELVVKNQFETAKEVMENASNDDPESFKNINLKLLGKFIVKPSKKNRLLNGSRTEDS